MATEVGRGDRSAPASVMSAATTAAKASWRHDLDVTAHVCMCDSKFSLCFTW